MTIVLPTRNGRNYGFNGVLALNVSGILASVNHKHLVR